ncbi:MAG: N-acetyltransferase [Zetaproteobacteria bacterium]|nr:N-acetyltransferase [Zetaproteobacteria bacterium]
MSGGQGASHLIRAAEISDVPAMAALLHKYAENGVLLPRSQDDIYQHLQEFVVALMDDGALCGVAALHVYGPGLAEVRSLAVDQQFHAQGIGQQLVQYIELWARDLGIHSLFALTYVDSFFMRQGYVLTTKESLPHKVWTVCVHCERFSRCDEIAVRKQLV